MLAHLQARLQRKADERGIVFPPWIPLLCSLIVIGVTVSAAMQRDLVWPPEPAFTAAVVIVVVAVAWVVSPVWIPWWVDVVTILPATAWLMSAPIAFGDTVDASPIILGTLIATITTIEGPLRGTLVWALALPLSLLAARPAPFEVPYFVFALCFGFAIGLIVHWQMRALQAERLARQEESDRAALAERQHIAREIHDLVAHSLSVTMLHVTGARRALAEDADIPDAIDALTDAERIGRQAMTDIRRTVGLLTTEPATTRALPGAGDLDELVDQVRAAGLHVSWRSEGDVTALPAAVGLALYRGLQESLANVARHAPGVPAEAELVVGLRHAQLEVRNPVPVGVRMGTGGNGLTGMASRAEQLGGALSSGPDGSSWRVVLRVPVKDDDGSGEPSDDRDEWCRLRRIFP